MKVKAARLVAAAIAATVVAAVLAVCFWPGADAEPPPAAQQPAGAVPPLAAPQPLAPAVVATVIAHPIDNDPAQDALPTAEHADAALQSALGAVLSTKLLALVLPDELIHHLVTTIDALPRQHLPAALVPLKRAAGALLTNGGGPTLAIDADNARRYSAYVELIKGVDAGQLVAVYRRFYPFFQQAYAQLGYPGAYFNDRLVAAIDDLLAAPEVDAPIALTQPKVLYEFADADVQARSAGQKIMIRIGRANAPPIKAKLREIRVLVARPR